MDYCKICTDCFNNSNKKITCSCGECYCVKCFENYLINSNKDFDCMYCHKIYDSEFMIKNVTQSVFKRLKTHRENVLFDREKAKLQETMMKYFEYDRFVEKIKNEIINLRILISDIRDELKYLTDDLSKVHDDDDKDMIKSVIKEKKQLKSQMNDELEKKRMIVSNWENYEKTEESDFKFDKKIIHKCPVDDCKGFVYSDGICGVCKSKICDMCWCVIHDEEHMCELESVNTVNTLKKDSKPCPNCATMIFKISGCDQMWCVQCHTAFDWKTSQIEKTHIHNPHYFDWLSQNKIENYDMDFWILNQHCIKYGDELIIKSFNEIYRLMTHIKYDEMPSLSDNTDPEKVNLDLRLKYLNNQIDDRKMKSELYKRERLNHFKKLKYEVFESIVNMFNELFNVTISTYNMSIMFSILCECTKTLENANSRFKELSDLYKLKTKQFVLIKNVINKYSHWELQ
jgi:hypothetical protein